MKKPNKQYLDVIIGISGIHLKLSINSLENFIACAFYIENDKELFTILQAKKKEIEQELGEAAEWRDVDVASIIVIKKEVGDVFDVSKQKEHFTWLYEKMLSFKKVFPKHCKEGAK